MAQRRRRAKRNPWDRMPFGVGVVGLAMIGTGLFAAWAWKNMAQRDKEKFLP